MIKIVEFRSDQIGLLVIGFEHWKCFFFVPCESGSNEKWVGTWFFYKEDENASMTCNKKKKLDTA